MQERLSRNNMEKVFGVSEIPTATGYGPCWTRHSRNIWVRCSMQYYRQPMKRACNGWHHLVLYLPVGKRRTDPVLEQEEQVLEVNWLEISIWNETKRKRTFYNSWITNKEITAENVKALADCERVRRKIENEHNNVLKNNGYNLEHNFGHGQAHVSENFCVLNLLAFLLIIEYNALFNLCLYFDNILSQNFNRVV